MSLSIEQLQMLAPFLDSLTVDDLNRAFSAAMSFAVEHDPSELERIAVCGRALPPEEVPVAWLPMRIENLLSESDLSSEEEIEQLYAELHRLSAVRSPKNEVSFREALARLRTLQQREADRLAAQFNARGHLDTNAVDATIARAQALLDGKDDHPSRDRSPG
ncbi:MAG: hypothetical protein EXR72_23865 [Myxococcales bacterium]|nr:hypothetical protein [Myxococcales bacterium]